MEQYYGELAALLTAVFWTITALAFESAKSKKLGSLSVNLPATCNSFRVPFGLRHGLAGVKPSLLMLAHTNGYGFRSLAWSASYWAIYSFFSRM